MTDNPYANELNLIDEIGLAGALRKILLAMLASALAVMALTLLLRWRHTPELALMAAAACFIALTLFRSGLIRLGLMLPLLTITYAVEHLAARSDGIQNIGLALVPVLVVVASLLLDRLMLVLFTVFGIVATGGMLAIRYFLLRSERYSTNDMGDLFIFAVTCAIAAVLGRLLVLRIKEAFQRVRTSESHCRYISEELRRRAEELQKIMDVAPVALFVAKDPKCCEVVVNRVGNAMLELPEGANSASAPGGPLPRPFFRDGIEVPVSELPLQTAVRGVDVRDSELETVLPSGRRRFLWGQATPLHDADGTVRGAVAAVQDVTEMRQRTDALLRESEARFQNAADAAPVILWLSDTENHLTFVNEQMMRFTGIPAEQLLGGGWEQVIHPDDLERARAFYYEGVDRRASYQLEYRARRADGEYRHMLGTTSPRYAGDTYLGHVDSVVDVTDLKRRQDEDIARQKLESMGTLASGIAHDFNNLLGGVLIQADLALQQLADGASPEEELKGIREGAIRGSEIVRQLMVYSGKEGEIPELVNVSEIVKDMLDLLRISISKQAVLETDLGTGLPRVRAHPAQLRQIVLNLVTNASEAIGDRHGVISVKTRCVTVGRDSPGMTWEHWVTGDYLRLEVLDTGCGIPRETQDRVFEAFFTTKSAGRGLGLAVVYRIVEGLGGMIRLESEPGEGTKVQILLPGAAIAEEPTKGRMTRTEEKPRESYGTILVVEDEDPLRHPLAKMLQKTGFNVIEATDGYGALEAIRSRQKRIDILLLDVTLPGAPSREVFEQAKRIRPEMKVIVTSAYSREMAAASLAGAVEHFIRKPYGFGELIDLMRQNLS